MIRFFNEKWNHRNNRKMKGVWMLIILMTIVFAITLVIVMIAYFIHPFVGILIEAVLIASTIAQKGLKDAAMEVYKPLASGNITTARSKLSQIVGRDTDQLSEEEIVRGTVETVAENTSDGVTSPLFWAMLGGAPFALTYRLINTCDSMVGYKNADYRDFGWASARFDDLVNWLPARLTGIAMLLVYRPSSGSFTSAWSLLRQDAKKHPSPNSGWGEATVAVLLGVRLGGINYYQGKKSYRREMGEGIHPLRLEHIQDTIRIMHRSVFLFLFILILGGMLFELAFAWF